MSVENEKQMKTPVEDEDPTKLAEKSEVSNNKFTYIVGPLLGQGGYGSVYEVREKTSGKLYAMKIEKKVENQPSKLKMEILILRLVMNERKTSHFTEIIDRGKKDKEGFFYLVMELAGPSLSQLKHKNGGVFSDATGISVSKQCLEACEDLHKYGFIHRDVKPANYACGYDNKHIIYILDFGIARKILNVRNELKTPRVSTKFRGTVCFASISCHKGIELGWKDDCESWFYLLLDLIIPQGLPWRGNKDADVVKKKKEESRLNRSKFFSGVNCQTELGKILDYIDKLKYQDHVDYLYIYRLLEEACTACGGKMDDPYDWEIEKA